MTDKRDITNSSPNKPGALHDSGSNSNSIIQQSLGSLTDQERQIIRTEAAKKALELEAKQIEQQLDYTTGRKVAEDHVDTWNMLNKDGKTTGHVLESDIKTGAGNMKIKSRSGAACFVATAAYADPNHADVVYLRGFRDIILSRYFAGRIFIDLYWVIGPSMARWVSANSVLRTLARWVLGKIVSTLRRLF